VRIGIVVEKVSDREAADHEGDAINIALALELIGAVRDIFLFASEPERLLDVVALRANFRERGACLLRLPVGESADAQRAVQAETLCKLGIEVKLAALPEPDAKKGRRRPGVLKLSAGGQAVGTAIERAKSRITLRQKRRLRMDVPDVGLGQRDFAAVGRPQRHIAELIVQAEFGETDARLHACIGQSEAAQIVGLPR